MRIHYAPSSKALHFTGRLLLRRQISLRAFSYGAKFHSAPYPNAYTLQRNLDLCIVRKGIVRPNFHIHVSVRDLYIPTFGPPIFLQYAAE